MDVLIFSIVRLKYDDIALNSFEVRTDKLTVKSPSPSAMFFSALFICLNIEVTYESDRKTAIAHIKKMPVPNKNALSRMVYICP